MTFAADCILNALMCASTLSDLRDSHPEILIRPALNALLAAKLIRVERREGLDFYVRIRKRRKNRNGRKHKGKSS